MERLHYLHGEPVTHVKSNREKSRQRYVSNDAARFILSQLLSEFIERRLTTSDLRKGYKGLTPSELKGLSTASAIGEVDFDLAMNDLTEHNLVKTGPMAVHDNPPGSLVIFIGLYSKNEYSYLTEDGYREASQVALTTQKMRSLPKSFAERKESIIHGNQYINYGPVGAIGQHAVGTVNTFHQCWLRIESDTDFTKLASELSVLRSEVVKSAVTPEDFVQVGILAEAECEAGTRNGPGMMKTLSKVAKAVFETAERIGTDLAAKVIVEASKG
jgi:hypothetical protein